MTARTQILYVDGRPATITLERAKLVIGVGGGERQIPIDGAELSIGTGNDNDVVLDDSAVSRAHCRIVREGDHFIIEDLGSTNGTWVNRARIIKAWLTPGSSVTVGNVSMGFASFEESVQIVPSDASQFGEIVGRDRRMREIYDIVERIAPTDATIVVEGETGTGKDVLAREIHVRSRRASSPFVVFDCSAVSETLVESELFGHEKGAFTGAVRARPGIFELAEGGTVFLDEIGELVPALQPKLLRVLEQREIRRVGGDRTVPVNVRVIAATNRNLESEVRAGRFREDLFYRLSVMRLVLPPLRDRKDDVALLVKHFLASRVNLTRDGGRKVTQVDREALERLVDHPWPGNVRELRNALERSIGLADGPMLGVSDLPEHIASGTPLRARRAAPAPGQPKPPAASDTLSVEVAGTYKEAKDRVVSAFEKLFVRGLLARNDGNVSAAAREADMDRKHLRRLASKYEAEDTEVEGSETHF